MGIETANTLQLVYFSQLLIQDSSQWPPAFEILNSLRYANNYNDIFRDSGYLSAERSETLMMGIDSKFLFMECEKFFLFNNSGNLLLLFVSFVVLWVSKRLKDRDWDRLIAEVNKDTRFNFNKANDRFVMAYQMTFIVCMISIGQILLGSHLDSFPYVIEAKSLISNNGPFSHLTIANKLLSLVFTVGVIAILTNEYLPIWVLNEDRNAKYAFAKRRVKYSRVYILYFLCEFCLTIYGNNLVFNGLFIGAISAVVVSTLYLVMILVMQPYYYTITLHTATILFNQLILIGFQSGVVLKNMYRERINQ